MYMQEILAQNRCDLGFVCLKPKTYTFIKVYTVNGYVFKNSRYN